MLHYLPLQVKSVFFVDVYGLLLYYQEKQGMDNIMENINLDILPKDGDRMLEELAAGNMVVTRSKSDFLYVLDDEEQFHMFTHTTGAPGGGQRQFPKDEKHTAMVRKLADLSDAVYLVEFDKNLNLYAVMYTAEEAILDMFPTLNRDEDGMVDFGLPDSEDENSK